MKTLIAILAILVFSSVVAAQNCPYDPRCLNNPYGAGNPFKPDGLMNPYSQYGNHYSNKSWTNPYATEAPRLFDSYGNYRGRFSVNPYQHDSISNPYGRYGNSFSYGNQFGNPVYVFPDED